ncbi:hypothetical protein MKX07_003281 [Trichoderma sp. CBMAI-0711]|nr:hypothetical protein MKX07_003281 [Trichoderma sp. CBMAI-0711]
MSTPFEFQVLEANAKYDSTYRHSGLECLFLRKAVIVTCMDCRLDPESAYGFELGEVTIIRNAGASGRDAASLRLTQEVVHGIMKKNLGLTESKDVDDFGVLTFLELEKSTREEVEYLRNHPLAWKQWRVTGWIHDMDTELLRKIVE